MPPAAAQAILLGVAAYLALGVAIALPFVTIAVPRIDPRARSAPILFRILIFPGVIALWPLLLRRGLGAMTTSESRES